MAKQGTCALCLKVAALQHSHLLPASIYRLARATREKNPHAVTLTKTKAFTSSRQLWAHLLCWDCEQKFRREGEDWVVAHCYRQGEAFKLRDILVASEPLYSDDPYDFYTSKAIPDLNTSALVYFAASVFWRASVREWPVGEVKVHLPLGAYDEELRRFLNREAPFPENAAIWVSVSVLPRPLNAMNFPRGPRMESFHSYDFHIPGITFDLYVGRGLPNWVKKFCAHVSGMVFATEKADRRIHQSLLASFQQASKHLPKYEYYAKAVTSG